MDDLVIEIKEITHRHILMKPVRACPICPECGSKRFVRISSTKKVRVKCISCDKVIEI